MQFSNCFPVIQLKLYYYAFYQLFMAVKYILIYTYKHEDKSGIHFSHFYKMKPIKKDKHDLAEFFY